MDAESTHTDSTHTHELPEDLVAEKEEIRSLEAILGREKEMIAPDISHLAPAVVDGELMAKPGDRITIERWVEINGRIRWLDTETYTYVRDNEETGSMHLWSETKKQWSLTRWQDWERYGLDVRLTAKGRSVSASPTKGGGTVVGSTKKGRAPKRSPLEVARSWKEYCEKRKKPIPEVYVKRLREAGEM